MLPLDIVAFAGKILGYGIFLLIGMGFGAALEMSGFGDSRKLAAQFYFKDMTVLKVMFTAIITACVLIFLFSAFGLLDYSNIWVNPTYLWPGIIGGFIMGIGFIVGGFCPGTSVVAASTLKIDGIFFLAGVFFGVGIFGEVVHSFEDFWLSSYMGRFTLFGWLGVDAGIVVLLAVLMALMMFYGAEIMEKVFGKGEKLKEVKFSPSNKYKMLATALLVLISLIIVFKGQPSSSDRWKWIEKKETLKIKNRSIYIHPGELLELMKDPLVYLKILDVRDESDFNLFHLEGAAMISLADTDNDLFLSDLKNLKDNTVFVLMSNNEKMATEIWKLLRAQNVMNLYILDGGINKWLDTFGIESETALRKGKLPEFQLDELNYKFFKALGSNHCSSNPCILDKGYPGKLNYEKKVKLKIKRATQKGCG